MPMFRYLLRSVMALSISGSGFLWLRSRASATAVPSEPCAKGPIALHRGKLRRPRRIVGNAVDCQCRGRASGIRRQAGARRLASLPERAVGSGTRPSRMMAGERCLRTSGSAPEWAPLAVLGMWLRAGDPEGGAERGRWRVGLEGASEGATPAGPGRVRVGCRAAARREATPADAERLRARRRPILPTRRGLLSVG